MARVQIPKNGYIKGNQDILLHGESYRLTCHNGYEFYSEEYGYINRRLVQIRNKNGTLKPKVPKCDESNVKPFKTFHLHDQFRFDSSNVVKFSKLISFKLIVHAVLWFLTKKWQKSEVK